MLIKHRPDPLFSPNEEWMYSNTGYIILVLLIDRISGLSYGEFLAQHIFSPLGMTRTEVYNRRASKSPVPEIFAFGYVYREDVGHYVLPDEVTELDYVYYLDGLQGDGMVKQEQLYMKLSNEMVLELLPLSPTRYFELQTATELEFGELHCGQTNQLVWYEGET